MSISAHASGANGNATGASVSVTLTPAVGDLLLVLAVETGTSLPLASAPTDSRSGTYSSFATGTFTGGRVYGFVRDSLIFDTASTIVTFNPSSINATGVELIVVALAGAGKAGSSIVRQSASNNGAGGTPPSVTLPGAALTTNALIALVGNVTNPAGVTVPSLWTSQQNVGQAVPLGADVASINSGSTLTTVTWASNSASAWGSLVVELDASQRGASDGVTATRALIAANPRARVPGLSLANSFAGFASRFVSLEESMFCPEVLQSTAITVPIVMRSSNTGIGVGGLAAALLTELKKAGGSYATITPTSIVDKGGGSYDVTLTGVHLNTLGIAQLRFTCTTTAGHDPIQIKDNVFLNVIAVNKQDAVRMGMASLPGVAAGAVGGLSTITAIGQGPGGTLKPNTVIDNYTYDANENPTAWRVRVFASAAASDAAYAAVNVATGQGNADTADGEIEREKYHAEYRANTKLLVALNRHKEL